MCVGGGEVAQNNHSEQVNKVRVFLFGLGKESNALIKGFFFFKEKAAKR